MKLIRTTDKGFNGAWRRILNRSSETPREVEAIVARIIKDVRHNGDRALLKYTQAFDDHTPKSLEVSRKETEAACRKIGRAEMASLKLAAARIRRFHERQAKNTRGSWKEPFDGAILGERISAIDRVGIYVPGGLAAYPSTVLMSAIPATIAGVREIIMVSPWRNGKANPYTLAAARLAGVDRVFKVGGAQAVAALAYGTKTIPAVDKIVGPGNIYVAVAKKQVFGKVGIDMIAGPTEVVIVADDSADPDFIAGDLLSQAEHDPQAMALLLTSSERLASSVRHSLKGQIQTSARGNILRRSLRSRGATIVTRSLTESVSLANEVGPEHLELQIRHPKKTVSLIRNAGAIFVGSFSPVAFGDYLAGPNHVLPTAGTSRFSSPLGVADFLKRSSVLEIGKKSFEKVAPHVIRLAKLEGLTAHAASVRIRLKGKKP